MLEVMLLLAGRWAGAGVPGIVSWATRAPGMMRASWARAGAPRRASCARGRAAAATTAAGWHRDCATGQPIG